MISESGGKLFFHVVNQAMDELGINRHEEDNFSLLVWHDSIKDTDYFRQLQPWQIVNRLPLINIICRKAPFVRSIQRISKYFRGVFNFLPRSYILPIQKDVFMNELKKKQKTYIVKPDNGALGQGIVIVKPGDDYTPTQHLSVAQEYKESYLINGYKFDLRIYCLVIAAEKPEIYVYHDGIARFCSLPADVGTEFSQLTNTAVNIKNPTVTAEGITKIVSDVFKQLKKEGADSDKLWDDIETAMALTVISAGSFIRHGAQVQCPMNGYPRCFQLLGFDVLLDTELKPWILEVNYRPSLESGTDAEKNLKVRMLKELIQIAAPYGMAEQALRNIKKKNINSEQWATFIKNHPDILKDAEDRKKEILAKSTFKQVFPNPPIQRKTWDDIYQFSLGLSYEIGNGYHLPRDTPTFTRYSVPVSSHSIKPILPNGLVQVTSGAIKKPKIRQSVQYRF